MTTGRTVARGVVRFGTLLPIKGGESYSFCHGRSKISRAHVARIRRFVGPWGVKFVQAKGRGARRHYFVIPAEVANALPDLASELVIDLANADLLYASYTAGEP